MMFWIVAAVVVVVLFALAWWSSGRSKGSTSDRQRAVDSGSDRGRNEAAANNLRNGGGIGGF